MESDIDQAAPGPREALANAAGGTESTDVAPTSTEDAPLVTPPAGTDDAPAPRPAPSVARGDLVRFSKPQAGISPDPTVVAIVLAVIPAAGDQPERIRVAELGVVALVETTRLSPV